MARRTKEEAQKMIKAVAVLVRNTTWKCGKVERLVVKYLQNRHIKYGRHQTSIKDMLQQFKLRGKERSEFFDALKRLERRQIIRIENIK